MMTRCCWATGDTDDIISRERCSNSIGGHLGDFCGAVREMIWSSGKLSVQQSFFGHLIGGVGIFIVTSLTSRFESDEMDDLCHLTTAVVGVLQIGLDNVKSIVPGLMVLANAEFGGKPGNVPSKGIPLCGVELNDSSGRLWRV